MKIKDEHSIEFILSMKIKCYMTRRNGSERRELAIFYKYLEEIFQEEFIKSQYRKFSEKSIDNYLKNF